MRVKLFKLIILSTSFFLTNCSTYVAPESVVDKMARFKSKHVNKNPVPAIKLWKTSKVKPKIAKSKPRKTEHVEHKVNHKNLYFKALYKQHNLFSKYLPKGQKHFLNHCPAFHNTFLKIKTPLASKAKAKTISKVKLKSLPADAPIYSLPSSHAKKSATLTVQQSKGHHKTIQEAVIAHSNRTLLELKEFCDTGTSLNYYNFANVITHVKNNKIAFHTDKEKSMKSLLKTTIYSNLAILKNLDSITDKGRFPASNTKQRIEASEVNRVLETDWTADYFDSL